MFRTLSACPFGYWLVACEVSHAADGRLPRLAVVAALHLHESCCCCKPAWSSAILPPPTLQATKLSSQHARLKETVAGLQAEQLALAAAKDSVRV